MYKRIMLFLGISSLSFGMEKQEKYYIDYMVTADNGAEERIILLPQQTVQQALDYLQDSNNSLHAVDYLRIYDRSEYKENTDLESTLQKITEKDAKPLSVLEAIQKIKRETGVENQANLSLDATTVPCINKKNYYIDYAVNVVLSMTQTQDFLHIRKTVKEAITHLIKCSFEDGRPNNLFVSLLRIYEDPQQTSHLCNEQSHTKIKEELLKFGAEEGKWDCTQAMNKIKQQIGLE